MINRIMANELKDAKSIAGIMKAKKYLDAQST